MSDGPKRGDRFVLNADGPSRERLFILVKRVAKDGTWADIFACNWAVAWTKRQPWKDPMPGLTRQEWSDADLQRQMVEWRP